MGYIKLEISKTTDGSGRASSAKIRRIFSDTGVSMFDLDRILHSLSAPSDKVQMWMVLGEGVLDRDKLKGREYMVLDSGTIDIDYIV